MGPCQQTILLTPPANRNFAWVLFPDKDLFLVQSTGRGMVNILSIKFTLPQYSIFINCLRSVASAPHGYSLVLDVTNITSLTLLPDFGRQARTLNVILAPGITMILNFNLILTILEYDNLVKSLWLIDWVPNCLCWWRNPVLVSLPCLSSTWPITV